MGLLLDDAQLLKSDFYQRSDVVMIANELLGKLLVTTIGGFCTSGIITETEAYSGRNDKACHANNGKRTKRNASMYLAGGHAYVYLCYGIHHLFNVVTNIENVADAVLIRAVAPNEGLLMMSERRGGIGVDRERLTAGPGALTKALAISLQHDGIPLSGAEVGIYDIGKNINHKDIVATKRIGIDYAGDDADRLWRFYIKDNKWVSKKIEK